MFVDVTGVDDDDCNVGTRVTAVVDEVGPSDLVVDVLLVWSTNMESAVCRVGMWSKSSSVRVVSTTHDFLLSKYEDGDNADSDEGEEGERIDTAAVVMMEVAAVEAELEVSEKGEGSMTSGCTGDVTSYSWRWE